MNQDRLCLAHVEWELIEAELEQATVAKVAYLLTVSCTTTISYVADLLNTRLFLPLSRITYILCAYSTTAWNGPLQC